jgi:hypothetical protein
MLNHEEVADICIAKCFGEMSQFVVVTSADLVPKVKLVGVGCGTNSVRIE